MSRPFRTSLVALIGVALLVPGAGAAAGWQEPPGPPQDEIAPPPPPPTTPTEPEEPVKPAGPTSITITVPPLPAKKAAPPKAEPQPAEPARPEPVRRSAPRRSVPVAEIPSEPRELEAPVVESTPTKKAVRKAKPAKKKAQRPQPAKEKAQRPQLRVVAKATAPTRPIRDREAAGAVLGAQFTLGDGSQGEGVNRALLFLFLSLTLAAVLGAVAGVVAAAPVLADRWPKVFVPVLDATERIVLAGIYVAGAALTLVITWAVTGPGS